MSLGHTRRNNKDFLLIDIAVEHNPKNTTIIAGSTAAHINYQKHWLVIQWNLTTTMPIYLHFK